MKFTKEKQVKHFIPFLDVFISSIYDQNLSLQTCHKSTYTGLLSKNYIKNRIISN